MILLFVRTYVRGLTDFSDEEIREVKRWEEEKE